MLYFWLGIFMVTTVNLAFSGGVESTYLLQLALEKGFDVNLCMINAGGVPEVRLGELIAMERIVKFYKEQMREQQDYLPRAQWTLKGRIMDDMHFAGCPFSARQSVSKSMVAFDVTQQFAIILGMLAIRREYVDHYMPTTWIGWIKEDCSDSTFFEMDHSEEDYQALLKLPEVIGSLSNADNIGVKFRAPLWEMSKSEIYSKLMDGVKPLLIPNGLSYPNWPNDRVDHVVYKDKQEEWKTAGIPCEREYRFPISEASWIARYVTGTLLPNDVGQDDTPECRKFLWAVAPYFVKARALIRPDDQNKIREEITRTVADLIAAAHAIPKVQAEKEQLVSEGESA